MPTVLFSGYYGFDNVGEEAILAASIATPGTTPGAGVREGREGYQGQPLDKYANQLTRTRAG